MSELSKNNPYKNCHDGSAEEWEAMEKFNKQLQEAMLEELKDHPTIPIGKYGMDTLIAQMAKIIDDMYPTRTFEVRVIPNTGDAARRVSPAIEIVETTKHISIGIIVEK